MKVVWHVLCCYILHWCLKLKTPWLILWCLSLGLGRRFTGDLLWELDRNIYRIDVFCVGHPQCLVTIVNDFILFHIIIDIICIVYAILLSQLCLESEKILTKCDKKDLLQYNLSLSCKFHKLVSLRTFLVRLSISTSRLSVSTSPMSSSCNINLPDYERLCILVLFIRKMISNIKTSKVNLILLSIKGYLLRTILHYKNPFLDIWYIV